MAMYLVPVSWFDHQWAYHPSRFQSGLGGSGLIPVDTVPAGYTREDVGSIPTPGHLQIDVTPLMVRGYGSAARPVVVSPLLVTTYNYFIYFGKLCPILDFICGQTGFFAVMYIEDKSSLVFWSLNYAIWYGQQLGFPSPS